MTKTDDLSAGRSGPARREFLGGAALLATGLAFAGAARADDQTGNADFLFVQTARGMSYDPATKRMTLQDVSPVTLFFTDRPDRIAGNMTTERFGKFWGEGKDSFLSDPPNADVSMIIDGSLQQTVVVLKDPQYDGTSLSYLVDGVDNEIPTSGGEVSVFIDIIGMPLTPVSYAGVARRSYRRAVMY